MLTWILIITLSLAGLLLIPVRLVFQGVWPGGEDNELVLYWLFGLLRLRLGGRHEEQPGKSKAPKTKRDWLVVLKDPEFTQRAIRFITDLWATLDTESLHVKLRVGLGSKAETGLLWLVMGPVARVLGNSPDATVRIEPDYRRATLELDGSGNVAALPLRLLWLGLGLLLSPAFRQGMRRAR